MYTWQIRSQILNLGQNILYIQIKMCSLKSDNRKDPLAHFSALTQVEGRGLVSLPYWLCYVKSHTRWHSPHIIMGTIKPDTLFIWLLLLSQSLLGRENSVRIKREMRHSSKSAVVALSGLWQKVQDGEMGCLLCIEKLLTNQQFLGRITFWELKNVVWVLFCCLLCVRYAEWITSDTGVLGSIMPMVLALRAFCKLQPCHRKA